MADEKLTALRISHPFVAPLAANDLLYLVQDTETSPEERAITGAELGTEFSTTAKARAYRTAAYTPGAANWVKIPFDTESYDPGSNFDAVTNNRFVAPVTGYYAVTGRFSVSSPAAGNIFSAAIYIDGVLHSKGNIAIAADDNTLGLVVNDIVYMAASSYVELWAYCSVARAFVVGSGETYMSVHLLSV